MATTHDLDRIWDTAMAQREQRARIRREPPLVRLWDANWELRGRISGEYSASFEWKLNDTGTGTVELPAEHHLARWVAQYWKRSTQNVHITVDKDGARWSGRLTEATTTQDDMGLRTTTLRFLHDFEELRHIQVWPNPFTPAAVQFPKTFLLAGPAIWALKCALFLNLFRLQGNLWRLPDDPLDFRSWVQSLNYRDWPILVQPSSLLLDDSQWTIISSRFKTWADMATPTLEDGQLMVTCRRWLIGDPQPWPGANLNRNGQLLIDIEDKSGWFEETAIGGTIAGGLIRTGIDIADNLIDEARFVLEKVTLADQYTIPGFLGVVPSQPWVVYRTDIDGHTNTAESTSFTWQPATVGQVTVGGSSMPGINEGISAAIQMGPAILSAFVPFIPNLGGPLDTVLQPLYSDVLLAFQSFKSPLRTRSLGWSHYYENFEDGADKAYTLSAVIALRAGFYKSRQRTSHTMKVGDGAPYLVGERGQGHFWLGDRVGGQIPGSPDGQVVVERVSALTLAWDAETPHQWDITLGDLTVDQDPLEYALSKIRGLTDALHDIGVV